MKRYDFNGNLLKGKKVVTELGRHKVPCLEYVDENGKTLRMQLVNLRTEEEHKQALHDQWAEDYDRSLETILKASERWLAYEAFCQQIGQEP